MKKIVSLLLIFILVFSHITYAESYVTMYSMDGREIRVLSGEINAYKKVGWYENKTDVEKVTMYSMDGRKIKVARIEIDAYKKVGWYEHLNDVTIKMYAMDGREKLVFKGEVDAYKKVGWYDNLNDVTIKMYAMDGREKLVFKGEVDAYKKVGWYENKIDVEKVTMYSMDGREIKVARIEIDAYKKVGWYENKEDILTNVCTKDGRKKSIFKNELAAYIKVGWIPEQSDKIDASKPMVALTFDDGPRTKSTSSILKTLEHYNAKATFFVVGNLAAGNAGLLKKMDSLGCQVGNHSYSHPNLATLSSYNVSVQINKTSNIIFNAIGKYPTVIRPPYGSYNKTTLNAAAKPFILWSIDTLDWKHKNASKIYNSIMSNVRDGDIILMHDLYDSTATAVESIVPALILKGYQLVTIDELAKYKNKPLSAYKTYGSIR